MRSAVALIAHDLRVRLRAPGALVGLALGTVALLAAVLGPGRGDGAATAAVSSSLLVAGVLAALAAAGSAGALPADRTSGCGTWLATLSVRPAAYRVAPALAGMALAAALAVAATGGAALLLAVVGLGVETARTTALETRVAAKDSASGPRRTSVAIDRADPASARTLELDLLPVYRDLDAAATATVPLEVLLETSSPFFSNLTFTAPVRGSVRIPLPPASRSAEVASGDPRVDLRVVGARLVGGSRPFAANLCLAGLLLGLAAAFAAPAAVLLSRGTSAPTAGAAAAVLILLGMAHGPLLSLASDVSGARGGAFPAAVLSAATALAPDLSATAAAGDASRGRFLPVSAFLDLWPAAVHAAVCLGLIAAWPARRRPS